MAVVLIGFHPTDIPAAFLQYAFMLIHRKHGPNHRAFKILLDLFASSLEKVRFKEVPFEFKERTKGESKLSFWVSYEYGILIIDKAIQRLALRVAQLFKGKKKSE